MSALLLLQAHGPLTGRELAKRLEVSERTVHRDMEALSAAGVPVFALRGANGGWQLDEDWRTQVPGLDAAELQALLMAQPRVVGDAQLAAAAESALGKLMAALPKTLREQAAAMQERLYVDTTAWRGATEDLSMLPIVQDAVSRDRKLFFRYWKNREQVERTVDPLGLIAKSGTWYLVARTPDGFRTYRISRMDAATVLDQTSERPPNFNLAAYWKVSAAKFQEELNREFEANRRAMAMKLEAERRTAQELEIAKQVQARLFPQRLPPCQTMEYAGICIQARQVGGDYYDFLDLSPGQSQERLGLVICDIAGKGIAAALLMANLQANLRGQAITGPDQMHRLLQSVNQLFFENTAGNSYATLFFAEYDGRTRRLRYANCGHLSALLLCSDNTLKWLTSTCTVLGLFEDWECSMEECQLYPGDTLVLYTDGVTESLNDAGEEFGEHRLAEALQQYREQPSQAMVASMVKAVQDFGLPEQHDDITLIVAKCRDKGAENQSLFVFS